MVKSIRAILQSPEIPEGEEVYFYYFQARADDNCSRDGTKQNHKSSSAHVSECSFNKTQGAPLCVCVSLCVCGVCVWYVRVCVCVACLVSSDLNCLWSLLLLFSAWDVSAWMVFIFEFCTALHTLCIYVRNVYMFFCFRNMSVLINQLKTASESSPWQVRVPMLAIHLPVSLFHFHLYLMHMTECM